MVQWVIWYEEFVVKSGVHAAAYQVYAPKFGSLKQKCSGKNILMPSLKLPNMGAHTRGKTCPFWGELSTSTDIGQICIQIIQPNLFNTIYRASANFSDIKSLFGKKWNYLNTSRSPLRTAI